MNEFIIKDYLVSKGFNIQNKGFYFLADGIMLYNSVEKIESMYIDVARKNKNKPRSVECAIRYIKIGTEYEKTGNKAMIAKLQYEIKKKSEFIGE